MKKLLLAIGLLFGGAVAAIAAGAFSNYPGVGVTANSNCTSYGNNSVCNQYQPAGPTFLTGTETFPADTNYVNPQGATIQPYTITVPTSFFAQGMGNSQVITTNASVVMADGVSTLISNQTTATIALINLPLNPSQNQIVKIVNAGSGVLTLTSIAVGVGSGHTIVQGAAPATLAIQTTGTQAAVADVAYLFKGTVWYRIH